MEDVRTSLVDAGFAIARVSDRKSAPTPPADLLPDGTRRFISFLFLALERV